MSEFTEASHWFRSTEGGFITEAPLPWEIGRKGSGLWLVVPPGTFFDVSIPNWLQWAIDPKGPRYLKAAALHDHALSSGWDRVSAAAAFSEALRADGVGKWLRVVMVISVVVWHWN